VVLLIIAVGFLDLISVLCTILAYYRSLGVCSAKCGPYIFMAFI
jgi:hypothetical protein